MNGLAVVVVGTDLDGGAVGEGHGSGIIEAVGTLYGVRERKLNGEGLALEGAALNGAGRSGSGLALIDDRYAGLADVALEGAAGHGEGTAGYGINIGAVSHAGAADIYGSGGAADIGEDDALAASLHIGDAAGVAELLILTDKEVVELVDLGNRYALVGGIGSRVAHQSGAGTREEERGGVLSGGNDRP